MSARAWFVYDPLGDGLCFYSSEGEARQVAEQILDAYRDMAASNGWPEEIEQVCWGRVSARATKGDEWPDPEGYWDFICDYQLTAPEHVGNPAGDPAPAPSSGCSSGAGK